MAAGHSFACVLGTKQAYLLRLLQASCHFSHGIHACCPAPDQLIVAYVLASPALPWLQPFTTQDHYYFCFSSKSLSQDLIFAPSFFQKNVYTLSIFTLLCWKIQTFHTVPNVTYMEQYLEKESYDVADSRVTEVH
jgi:hypothetical protein